MIRVAIADDHPTFIRGIENLLHEHPLIQLIATYRDGQEVLSRIENDIPDVLLLDIQMPGRTGDELVPILLNKLPVLKIAILTNFDSTFYIESLFNSGVHGYLLKTSDGEVIIEAIQRIDAGESYLHPALKQKLEEFSKYKTKLTRSKLELTNRERQIVQLIADGLTTQEIADKLFLSFRTVENYRQNILHKMDCRNVAAMIKKAIILGLI